MMFPIIQMISTIFTLVGLFGGDVTPVGNTARAMLVYILPILIIANAILLAYWLITRKWIWASIPFLTLLCCIPYISTIYQFGEYPSDSDARQGIKIATYNVAAFGRETSGFMALDILAEMKRQKVDVLCLQEYSEVCGDKRNSVSYKEYFKGNFKTHLVGILGGSIWCLGTAFSYIASGKAGAAISYALGQGAPMIAAIWGVFIWKGFKGANKNVYSLLGLMFLFFIAGLGCIIISGN